MIKIIFVFGLLCLAVVLLSSMERRSLYFPDPVLAATPRAYGLAFEDLSLKTADGVTLHAWYIPAPEKRPRSWTLLLCHGNAGNISHRLEKAHLFHNFGMNVLLFDYRGYGQSVGTPSERGTYADGEAAYLYLTGARALSPDRIAIYGESLGGAIAIELARRHPAGALLLESAFTSTVDMGKLLFPWLPVERIVRYSYDNLAKIALLRVPLLVMHSPEDEIVPYSMGKALYAAAPEPKTFVELAGGHNDGYAIAGERYRQAIREFLR